MQVSPWRGRIVVHHIGADAGYRSFFAALPEEGVAAMIMSNLAEAPVDRLCQQALLTVLGQPAGMPDDLEEWSDGIDWAGVPALPTTAEALRDYPGRYLSDEVAAVLRIERDGDRLLLVRPRYARARLQRIADRTFVVRPGAADGESEWSALVVTFDEAGTMLSLSGDRARNVGFHRVATAVDPGSSATPRRCRANAQ